MRHIRQFCPHPASRPLICAFGALMALAGCGSDSSGLQPTETVVRTFAGAVVGDEPRAVVEARSALNAGGTAADAATAMFFTLAATLPSSASLGGGGMCVVYDASSGKAEALDFIARAPAAVPANAERPSAVPGNAFGFWALHARYGKLNWAQLVSPGERLARFGVQASRTLIGDFRPVAAPLLEDPESRRVFADATGRPIAEGTSFVQPDLARVLAAIRVGGAMELYRGALARELVAGVKAAGGSLELADLENYKPEWRATVQVKDGSEIAHFVPPPAAAGTVAAQMFAMLDGRADFEGAGEVERLHALADTGLRAFADRARWMREDYGSTDPVSQLAAPATIERLMRTYDPRRHTAAAAFSPVPVARPETPAATSFVIVDRAGSAVSCALTMNNNFGTGRIARGTGIMLAALPSAQGRGPISLGPMLVMNESSKQFFFAAGASGGVAAPTSLMNVAARVVLAEQPLDAAMTAPRVHHGGAPDVTYHEPGVPRDDVAQLASWGHSLAATPTLGTVNAISCPGGMPRDKKSCIALADPRGSGIALSVGE